MTVVDSVPLGMLLAPGRGSVDPSKFPNEMFDLYSIAAYDSLEPEVLRGHAIGSLKQMVEPGDVLLSKIVPHIRRTWVVGEHRGRRMIASGEWIIFRSAKVIPNYLRHVLQGDTFRTDFMTTVAGVGGSLLRARPAQVATLTVPLPETAEQERIAAILNQAEELRAKRQVALAKHRALAQSMFLEMFGDLSTDSCSMATIEDVADQRSGSIRTGPFGSQLLHSEFTNSGVAVLGIDNAVHNEFRWGERRFISEEKYRELARYTVKAGDVLITIMGTCGRCAIVPDDIPLAINTKHLCCITLDRKKCLPAFLHAYFLWHPLARSYLSEKAKGAIMEGLNMGVIKGMPIPLAPMVLQEKLEKVLGILERSVGDQERSEGRIEALESSLRYHAFRGEL